ncbi:NUDIX hydrolase [Microbacterium album]|uniref:MutT/NUDIX family protein n=1 Tax=Microbacterium album TaxID=2053191 RepID=A0A917MLK5_9MICO|nr:NUDIX domain-containing protein [Microbacterium album]GGH43255.1 MutT/NUDIX family protein [Microbacterium album]
MPVITVSAIAFLRADGRVLTVRKRGTSAYMLPGGKPEAGETALATAVREVREELGIRVSPEQLESLGTFETRAANEAGHALRATVFLARGDVAPVAQAEIDDLRWEDPAAASPGSAPLNVEHVFPVLERRAAEAR